MKEKTKKIGKILLLILRITIWIALAAFILVVCLQRFSDNKISFFNYRMFTVVSQSMTPKYDIGDVLISKETDPLKVEQDLLKKIPKKHWRLMNHLLVYHGRAVCDARKPKCEECTIAGCCKEYKKNTTKKGL